MKNFVSYNDASTLFAKVGQKFEALAGAYIPRGNSTFANLPATLTEAMAGYVYNVTTDFTTDARFVEGAGSQHKAGTNVVVVDLSTYDAVTPEVGDVPATEGWYELVSGKYVLSADTEVDSGKTYYEKTVVVKFDVIGSFVDIGAINNRLDAISDMIAGEFDDTTAYNTGDIVVYEDALYKFKADHAAGAWDASEVDEISVVDLINAAEPDSLTTEQINNLLALLD